MPRQSMRANMEANILQALKKDVAAGHIMQGGSRFADDGVAYTKQEDFDEFRAWQPWRPSYIVYTYTSTYLHRINVSLRSGGHLY